MAQDLEAWLPKCRIEGSPQAKVKPLSRCIAASLMVYRRKSKSVGEGVEEKCNGAALNCHQAAARNWPTMLVPLSSHLHE